MEAASSTGTGHTLVPACASQRRSWWPSRRSTPSTSHTGWVRCPGPAQVSMAPKPQLAMGVRWLHGWLAVPGASLLPWVLGVTFLVTAHISLSATTHGGHKGHLSSGHCTTGSNPPPAHFQQYSRRTVVWHTHTHTYTHKTRLMGVGVYWGWGCGSLVAIRSPWPHRAPLHPAAGNSQRSAKHALLMPFLGSTDNA